MGRSKGMDYRSPAQAAYPDYQGQFQTCTRHALSKACVDGFFLQKFHPDQLDFDQHQVTKALYNVHPGQAGQGKWPDDFHGIPVRGPESGSFRDLTTGKIWDVNMNQVQQVTSDIIEDLADAPSQDATFVLVYEYYRHPLSLHTVYIKGVGHCNIPGVGTRTIISCINSHGYNDQYPYVDLMSHGNVFYEVKCTATEVPFAELANRGHPDMNVHALASPGSAVETEAPGSGYLGLEEYNEESYALSTKEALLEAYIDGKRQGLYPEFDIESFLSSNAGVRPTDFIITSDYQGAGGFTFSVS